MKPQAYQKPTIYNSDGTKAQIGTYDIRTDPLTNSTADGILDYINNNLEALHDDAANTYLDKLSKTEQVVTAPIKGTLNGNATSATKLQTARTINVQDASASNTGTGASFDGSGNATIKLPAKIKATLTGNADTATKATNDGNGNPIASTYLPLSGGTLTGVVNGVTPTAGDNSTKIATTEFVNAKAGNYLPLSGGTMTGSIQYVNNGKVFRIAKSDDGYVALYWDWDRREGAGLNLRSADYSRPGEFTLFARDSANSCSLDGKPDGTLTWNSQPLLPVGIVQAFAGTTIPSGWLLCDGSAVSRTTYANLYACIGTTYGAGDGSTTFNLPNLVDKFVEGSATAGTVKSAGLPNITGSFATRYPWNNAVSNGAFKNQPTSEPTFTQSYTETKVNHNAFSFDASYSNSIYGNSTTVQPPALTMRYIIKY